MFIHVHARMHVFIPGQHVDQTVCVIWSCTFQRSPTRGWSARHILLPYLSWCVHHGWIYSLLLFFSFTSFNPTPWIFAFSGFSAVSDLYRLLSDMLHSWGSFDFSMSLKFLEWVTKLSANFSNYYHAICIFFTVQFPRGICSCFRVFDHMNARLAAFFWGDLFCP